MARVSNEVELNEFIGLSAEGFDMIESVDWIITDVGQDFEYEKDASGKKVKTDTVKGCSLMVLGPRKGPKAVRNKALKVKVEELWTLEECEQIAEMQPEVKMKIIKTVPWISGTTYPQINLSITVKLTNSETGELFDVSNMASEDSE